ncbi:hypothetical protein D3C80_2158750 [compost metagenome]
MLFLGGVEGVEYLAQVFCPNTLPTIPDTNHHAPVIPVTRGKRQRPAIGHAMDRIDDQVDQDLL